MITIMIIIQFLYIKERPKTSMQKCIINVTLPLKYARISPNSLKKGQTADKICSETSKICKDDSLSLLFI